MIALVKKYNSYIESLPKLIENSDYKMDFFVKKLSISKPTLYRKLRENAFTNNEVEIITEILFPREIMREEMLEGIEQGRQDYLEGRTKTSKEVRANINAKYRL
ncbi:hypothetical protein [Aequorivita lipolytica]|jgi:hypothetical protein|uniref:Uncharacterized protein n=1 Tax=Aequorivita lipolytica TaxID=153267 RepID=A0A5C6YSJ0_9FLAO|nr:hypothetical protein [Aequorivita lipolytica]TXD69884.1 hypothetical protein ESV24_05460 [Aequorivita lipolytica]SRX50296.1 hypothetical protein AEQU2_00768 [Aequorivita lipolytica]